MLNPRGAELGVKHALSLAAFDELQHRVGRREAEVGVLAKYARITEKEENAICHGDHRGYNAARCI
jgi:hypothetical protein